MKYCKMDVLFLYLVIRGGHVTVYLTARNLLQASLQPHLAPLKSINQICAFHNTSVQWLMFWAIQNARACTHFGGHACLRQPHQPFSPVMETVLRRVAVVCVVA